MRKIFILLLLCILLASCTSQPANTTSDSSVQESSVLAESEASSLPREESSEIAEAVSQEVSEDAPDTLTDRVLEVEWMITEASMGLFSAFEDDRDPFLICSYDQWNSFLELLQREPNYFIETIPPYDEAFFEENILLVKPEIYGNLGPWTVLIDLRLRADGILHMVGTEIYQPGGAAMSVRLLFAVIPKSEGIPEDVQMKYGICIPQFCRFDVAAQEPFVGAYATYDELLEGVGEIFPQIAETLGSDEYRRRNEGKYRTYFFWVPPEEYAQLHLELYDIRFTQDGTIEFVMGPCAPDRYKEPENGYVDAIVFVGYNLPPCVDRKNIRFIVETEYRESDWKNPDVQ